MNTVCGQSDKMFLIILALFFMLVMLSTTYKSTTGINERMTNVSPTKVDKINFSEAPKLIKNSEIDRLEDQYSGKYCPKQPLIGKGRGYLNWEQLY
jgi:hypothetical protein